MSGTYSPRAKLNTHDYNVETKGRLPEVHRFEHLAELARKRGEKEIETANNNIRTEYRKRLHDTKEMKSRMEHCISTLNIEIGTLERCKSEIVEGLRNFEPNLALSAQYNDLRKGRPSSPSIHYENVVRAIAQNNEELKQNVSRLSQVLAQLEESLRELRQCQKYVSNEINAKMTTMIIDNACMEELINPNDLIGDLPMKSQSALMQSSKMHTSNEWSNTAESVISTALAQIEVSQLRRKKALSVLRIIREAGKYNRNPLVLDAFQARMKHNQGQVASLDLNISMISGQIEQLEKQKASLVGFLDKILQQQDIAKQRLNVRAMLPSKENTRPNVETTLEVEIVNSERNEKDLRAKLKELEKNLVKQQTLRASMKQEHKERTDALNLDKSCFELRLPPLSKEMLQTVYPKGERNVLETGSARGSGRSSVRHSIPAPPPQQLDSPLNFLSNESGRSIARPSGVSERSARSSERQSSRSTATGGGVPTTVAAASAGFFPSIPAPPSARGKQLPSDVEALLRARTPSGSARSGRAGSSRR